MKKTCRNCIHFHGCLGEEESFYHIHDYCDVLDRTFSCPMYSIINSFLEDYCTDFDFISDDHETGESSCYRFDPIDTEDEKFGDAWMKENFEHNKKLALDLLDKIITEGKCYNNIIGKEEILTEIADLNYFVDLREQIKKINWEN